jgi:hypothetical protein
MLFNRNKQIVSNLEIGRGIDGALFGVGWTQIDDNCIGGIAQTMVRR